jgi:hypothetical protein
MTVEYRCGQCREKTDPPAPYKMYVLCPCGRMTSASAAAVRLSEQKVVEPLVQTANPHAVAYIRKVLLEEIKTENHVFAMLSGQSNWVEEEPDDYLAPLYDQTYVSSLEAEIERLKLRVQALESGKVE